RGFRCVVAVAGRRARCRRLPARLVEAPRWSARSQAAAPPRRGPRLQLPDRPPLRAPGVVGVAARAAGESVRLALVDQAKGVDMNVSLRALALAAVTTAALAAAASAAAHARVSPPVALSKFGQL